MIVIGTAKCVLCEQTIDLRARKCAPYRYRRETWHHLPRTHGQRRKYRHQATPIARTVRVFR